MFVSKALTAPSKVFVCRNTSDNTRAIEINLSERGRNCSYNFITIDGEEVRLDWNKDLPSAKKKELSEIRILRRRGEIDKAVIKSYFLIYELINKATTPSEINVGLLGKTLIGLSRIYQSNGDWDAAERYASFVSELDPENIYANQSVAVCIRDGGKSDDLYESVPFAEAAVHSDPSSISARKTLAITYRQAELAELGLEHSEWAFELERLKPSEHRLASTYTTFAAILIDLANKKMFLGEKPDTEVYYKWAKEVLDLGSRELRGYEVNNFNNLKDVVLDLVSPEIHNKYFSEAAA